MVILVTRLSIIFISSKEVIDDIVQVGHGGESHTLNCVTLALPLSLGDTITNHPPPPRGWGDSEREWCGMIGGYYHPKAQACPHTELFTVVCG